jgi:hypothetical protein
MRQLILITIAILSISCNVEKRINDGSYTDYWHYENGIRYQVYKTGSGKKYIIIVNKRETKMIRKYINL